MKTCTVIIGGGPAGVVAATTARSMNPDKTVCLIKEIGDGVIPCAIPYMVHSMEDPEQNRMGNLPLDKAGVNVIVDRVVSFDPDERRLRLGSGDELQYDRLILATGTVPARPPIPGIDLQGVSVIEKSLSAMTALREAIKSARKVVILGGGFIGAEFADELVKDPETEVHVIEMMPKLLEAAFDDEICDEVQKVLESEGVIVHTGTRAMSINGKDRVESVTLDDGQEIAADIVVLGVGGTPDTTLAKDAGLRVTDSGSIWVDEYMRTSAPGVLAVGDCALKRDFFTRREVPVWLASTAAAEARIAATNLYEIRVVRQIQGTISAFSTQFGGVSFASAGLSARMCEKEGFRFVEGTAAAPDRHPGSLDGATMLKVKLVFADDSGILLGGQLMGGPSVGELINAIAFGIQKKVTVRELDMMQIATHPLLTSAPTVHPLIGAAYDALERLLSRNP